MKGREKDRERDCGRETERERERDRGRETERERLWKRETERERLWKRESVSVCTSRAILSTVPGGSPCVLSEKQSFSSSLPAETGNERKGERFDERRYERSVERGKGVVGVAPQYGIKTVIQASSVSVCRVVFIARAVVAVVAVAHVDAVSVVVAVAVGAVQRSHRALLNVGE